MGAILRITPSGAKSASPVAFGNMKMEDGNGPKGVLDIDLSATLQALVEEIRAQPVSDRLRELSQELQEALTRARANKEE
jgi:hypothetical protein